MFARGVFSFQPARLPAFPENLPSQIIPTLARLSRKFSHSRTYRVPGGGGYTGLFVRPTRFVSKSFVSPTSKIPVRNSFVSPTYAKTGGWAPSGSKPLKLSLKCRRADIFVFSPYFLCFFACRLSLLVPPIQPTPPSRHPPLS